MSKFLLICFLLGWVMPSQAESNNSHYEKLFGKLPNGLSYYVASTPWIKGKCALGMVVKTGSLYETKDEIGIAHFLEHLCSSCVPGYDADYMLNGVQRGGLNVFTDFQAFTSDSKTVYKYTYPNDDVETEHLFMEFTRGVLTNMEFTKKAVDIERPIILKETQTSFSNSVKSTFAGGYYEQHLPLGNTDQLNAISADKIDKFYKKWYNLNNLAIVLVGDLPLEKLKRKVLENFGPLINRGNPINDVALFPYEHTNIQLYNPKKIRGESMVSWRFPLEDMSRDEGIKRMICNEMVCNLLKGSVEAFDKGMKVNVSMHTNMPKTSLVNILFNADDSSSFNKKIKSLTVCASQIMHGEIRKSLMDSIWRDYSSQLTTFVPSGDQVTLEKVVNEIFSVFINGAPFVTRDEYTQRLEQIYSTITATDVQNAAKNIFSGNYGMIGYLPDYGDKWQKMIVSSFLRDLQKYDQATALHVPEKLKIAPSYHDKRKNIDRSNIEFSKKMILKHRELPNGFIQYDLKNGMRLVWKKSKLENSLLLKVDSKAIDKNLSLNNKQLCTIKSTRELELLNSDGEVIKDVLNGWDLRSCSIAINSKGVTLSAHWDERNEEFLFHYLCSLYDRLQLEPSSYDQQLKKYNSKKLPVEKNSYQQIYSKLRDGYYPSVSESGKTFLSKKESEEIIKRIFNPNNSTLFVSGDVDIERVIAYLSTIKPQANSHRKREKSIYLEWTPSVDTLVENPSNAKTKLVNRLFKMSTKNLKLRDILLAGMLEEYLSRMTLKEIRTERGLIYSWGSSTEIVTEPQTSTIVGIRFKIVPDLLEESLNVLDDMCENIRVAGVTDDDLVGLKQRQWNRYLDYYNNSEEFLPFLSHQYMWSQTIISDEDLKKELKSITLKEFNNYVNKHLSQNSVTLIK